MILYHIWPTLYHIWPTLLPGYQILIFRRNQPSSLGYYFWEIFVFAWFPYVFQHFYIFIVNDFHKFNLHHSERAAYTILFIESYKITFWSFKSLQCKEWFKWEWFQPQIHKLSFFFFNLIVMFFQKLKARIANIAKIVTNNITVCIVNWAARSALTVSIARLVLRFALQQDSVGKSAE